MNPLQQGKRNHMKFRLVIVSAGVVALLVGIVGLITPVSVSPDQRIIGCGSAIAPDLLEARAHDDASAANVAILGEVGTDANATRLCDKDLEDRRFWTITLAGVGVLAVLAVGAQAALSRRAKSST